MSAPKPIDQVRAQVERAPADLGIAGLPMARALLEYARRLEELEDRAARDVARLRADLERLAKERADADARAAELGSQLRAMEIRHRHEDLDREMRERAAAYDERRARERKEGR